PTMQRHELDERHTMFVAHVAWIDRFGNAQLSLSGDVLEDATSATLRTGAHDVSVQVIRAYAALAPGAIGALRDANDAVAIVVREGSAARRLEVAVGDRVELVVGFGPP